MRIRVSEGQAVPLTEPRLAGGLLDLARRHHDLGLWWCELFLLMPDHVHAIVDIPGRSAIAGIVRDWKREADRLLGVSWHAGFDDNLLGQRNEADDKWWYVRYNPVARGLCAIEDDWRLWWSALSPMI